MKTKTIKVYTITELSDDAKDHAYHEWLNSWEYRWGSENEESLKAFAAIFPVKIKDWSYGGRGEGVDFEMMCNDEVTELTSHRLAKYIWNNYQNKIWKGKYYSTGGHYDEKKQYQYKQRHSKIQLESSCPLTGYCVDDDILKPVLDFLKKPTEQNFKEVVEDCFHSWVKHCTDDMEYSSSMETFLEDAEANQYEFTEDGKRA